MNASILRVIRPLSHFNYRIWAIGALVSNIGTWVQRTAQDWLVLTGLTHHSASAVGTVMALQFGPQFLLLPWTGVAADRCNKRHLLMATQAIMGALALMLGILTVTGIIRLWEVYIFAALFGCAAAFDAPVRQTFVAELVGDAELPAAVGVNSMSFNAARMIGPAVCGIVIASIGTGWAFLTNGASFLAVLGSLALLRVSELHPHARSHHGKGAFVEGLRYVWARPDLKAILAMLFLIGTFGLNFPIFTATMAVKVFHANAKEYGLLSSIMAVGTVVGSFLSAGSGEARFRALMTGTLVFGTGCTLAALAPSYWLFAITLTIIGVATLLFTSTTNSVMQLTTEPFMRGRVMALRVGIALGGAPIGAPFVGWVADSFGPRWALGVGALSGFAAAMIGWLTLRKLDLQPRGMPERTPGDTPPHPPQATAARAEQNP
ncbi:MFS transporter [Brytella acorum]|uniref:MFS transporter n=1 Tax=Brytella acorum TaxID=2959299 RepID=A0AA35Y1K7_9PROT|nr:MFS transporter [Brytella acorum]MDF3624216.1 MFS transporter [Brytella acorum]CAI9120722.1 MFS transporter [Brytella acorum]